MKTSLSLIYFFFLMGIQLNRPVIVEIVLCVFIVLALSRISTSVEQPANFVFGDSLVDVGNNNYIASISKANFLPFGVDLGRPTGRFTNGRTIVDILGKIITFFSLSSFTYMLFGFLFIYLSNDSFLMHHHQVRNWVLVLPHLTWLPLQLDQWF